MIEIIKDENGYPISITEDGKIIEYCPYDDKIIEINCSFQDMKRHISEGCPEGLRYGFLERELDFFESESVSILYITVQENNLSFIGSVDLIHEVRDDKCGLKDLVIALEKQVKYSNGILINYYELDEEAYILFEKHYSCECNLEENIKSFVKDIDDLIENSKISLGIFQWKEKYLKDELVFCREILTPLFLRMGFLSVKFNHGTTEFGKDYLLAEMTKFNNIRYYGVQVKAGNIDGGVNSKIDEIISQIKDAFEMPFGITGINSQHYISALLIFISGKFTSNAKDKILYKIPKGFVGSVSFFDSEDIENLIMKYWIQNQF